jgi:hypothetical protein
MTESGDVSAGYPVGTILQLFPFEAMVKRKPGFASERPALHQEVSD